MKLLAAALSLVFAASTARAQPGTVAPIEPGDQDEPPPGQPVAQQPTWSAPRPPQEPVAERSESTALWLSLGGTLGSYALVFGGSMVASQVRDQSSSSLAGSAISVGLVGTLLAPTFGHWYAGKGFTRGFALRLGALGVGVTAIVVALSGCSLGFGGHEQPDDPDCGQGAPAGAVLGLVAAGMWIGGTVDDIVQAPRRVRLRNEARFAVTPLIQHDSAGLVLVGAF